MEPLNSFLSRNSSLSFPWNSATFVVVSHWSDSSNARFVYKPSSPISLSVRIWEAPIDLLCISVWRAWKVSSWFILLHSSKDLPLFWRIISRMLASATLPFLFFLVIREKERSRGVETNILSSCKHHMVTGAASLREQRQYMNRICAWNKATAIPLALDGGVR